MTKEDIAQVCHEANRGLCETQGDFSQRHFREAPDWAVASAIAGVEFNLANPDAPASASHESWLAEKERTGWRYGETKDELAKTHPCFVEYDKLPAAQKAKDHLFKAIVGALAPFVE